MLLCIISRSSQYAFTYEALTHCSMAPTMENKPKLGYTCLETTPTKEAKYLLSFLHASADQPFLLFPSYILFITIFLNIASCVSL